MSTKKYCSLGFDTTMLLFLGADLLLLDFERFRGEFERDDAFSGRGLGGLYFSLTGMMSSRTTQL
jgi:hypothetical protein